MTDSTTISKSENKTQQSSLSFESLYKRYFGRVAAVVRQFKFTDAAADDLIQDVFVQAWQRLDSLSDPAAFGAWVSTIARNRCLNEIRKKKPSLVINTQDHLDEDNSDEVVLVADDHLASFHFEHSVSLLRDLISAHEGQPRATIAQLFYIDELPIKEICSRLDLKQNTVLSHLRRFRMIVSKAMMRLVEERGLEPYS